MKKHLKPWGYYRNLLSIRYMKFKILKIYPEQSISLQKHNYRSELWFILGKNFIISINNSIIIKENFAVVNISKNIKHRIKNIGRKNVYIFEIQYGSKCIEEDIERFEDEYNRI